MNGLELELESRSELGSSRGEDLSKGSASVGVLRHFLKQGSAACDGFKPGADTGFIQLV